MEEHYFLRAWKLRQGMAEEGERETAPEMEVCFQFLFASAAHRNGEGKSHIEAIFFVGSGAAEWNWASVERGPPTAATSGTCILATSSAYFQVTPRIARVYRLGPLSTSIIRRMLFSECDDAAVTNCAGQLPLSLALKCSQEIYRGRCTLQR